MNKFIAVALGSVAIVIVMVVITPARIAAAKPVQKELTCKERAQNMRELVESKGYSEDTANRQADGILSMCLEVHPEE